MVVINQTTSFLAPVKPDGRELVATATMRGRKNGILVTTVEASDADGRTVMTGQGTAMLLERYPRSRQRIADRLLLTVLFTDLCDSTERVSVLGDAAWRELLEQHHTSVRRQLELHGGREVKTTGDGFLATFDSPTRAVRCARAIRSEIDRIGLQVKAGIHTGECDIVAGDISGVAVHVASRIESVAKGGEILISSTVRSLIAGSELQLIDRGDHDLKGLDGPWTLFAVE